MHAWNAVMPHVRRRCNQNFDGPGVGSALNIRKAKSPWEVVANRVGSDILSERDSYPLNLRQLEEKDTRPNAPFADGYSTRYSEIINC
jgi:hypothetical protein